MFQQRTLALGHVRPGRSLARRRPDLRSARVSRPRRCFRVEKLVPRAFKVATRHGHPFSATIYFTAYCLLPAILNTARPGGSNIPPARLERDGAMF